MSVALLALYWRGVPFPTPWSTGAALFRVLFARDPLSGEFYEHLGSSLTRLRRNAIGPVAALLQTVPAVAWVPVVLLLVRDKMIAMPIVVAPAPDRAAVFCRPALFPWLTLVDNVAFSLQCQGVSLDTARPVALAHLRNVGLEPFARAYPEQVSVTMQQRTALARVWATGSPLVFVDDGVLGAAVEFRLPLRKQLLALWRDSGKTIVFLTTAEAEATVLVREFDSLVRDPIRYVKI